jgi:hypothetical protein
MAHFTTLLLSALDPFLSFLFRLVNAALKLCQELVPREGYGKVREEKAAVGGRVATEGR